MGAHSKSKTTYPEPDALPTQAELEQADKATFYRADGTTTTFGEVRAAGRGRRLILIFIRHFHCGLCSAYVGALSDEPALANERVVIVGHGAPEGIERYREVSGARSTFEIYADPKKNLFRALGVTRRSLDLGTKTPTYQKGSVLHMVLSGIRESLGSGLLAFKGGDLAQLGAEMVLDAEGRAIFAHRMVNTRDHTEVPDLVRAIGIGA